MHRPNLYAVKTLPERDLSPLSDDEQQIVDLTKGHRGYAVVRGARSFEWLMQLLDRIIAGPWDSRTVASAATQPRTLPEFAH